MIIKVSAPNEESINSLGLVRVLIGRCQVFIATLNEVNIWFLVIKGKRIKS